MPTIWLYARVSQDETSIHCCGKPHRLAFGKTTTCDRCGREIANNEVPDRVKSQFADMRRLVEYRQLQGDIVELWEVTSAASAPLRKREHGRMLLTHTKRGDHVVAVHLFRLFRGMKDTVLSMEELAKRGVNVHCVQHDIDTTSAMGRAFVQFLGIIRATGDVPSLCGLSDDDVYLGAGAGLHRIYDGSCPIAKALSRFARISPTSYREYNQPYFAANKPKVE